MHSILFVIPGLKTGGTNSSLSALYSQIKAEYKIVVLPLSRYRNAHYSFDEAVVNSSLFISAFHDKISDLAWYNRPLAFLLKSFRRVILTLFSYDILDWIYKKSVDNIESDSKFEYIVAFEESYPTKYVSLFKNVNKIAWIHCDYDKYCPLSISEEGIYNCFKRIICVSKHTSQKFIARYPSLSTRVHFIYNLIDVYSIIQKSNLVVDDSRFRTNNKFVLISAGRLDPVKRFSSIPILAKRLLSMGLDFQWYIIGPVAVQSELDNLNKNILSCGVEKNVLYLGNKSNPYPYFKNADLYVCTSESEACPMVFNEAMILNTPVITTNFGSASEFIDNKKNGFICELDDIPEIVCNILTHKEVYNKIQKELVDISRFNSEIVSKIIKLFS